MSSKKQQNQQYDYLAKAIIVGDSAVGKSNILLRYVKQEYRMSHLTTIGVDFKIKTVKVDDAKIKMQIWDTAGQQRFKAITQTYFRGAHAAILVYAINDRRSFKNIQNWIRKINDSEGSMGMVLVGNKSDIERHRRQVSVQEGQQLGKKYQIPFIQCSAKENNNIQQIFREVGKLIHQNIKNLGKKSNKQQFRIEENPSPMSRCQC